MLTKSATSLEQNFNPSPSEPGVIKVKPTEPSPNGSGIPPKFIVTLKGKDAPNGDLTAHIFNNTALNAAPSGGEAANGDIIYGDGFTGKLYERALILADALGRGVKFYGFNITATDEATGEPDSTVFDTINLQVREYIGKGNSYRPVDLDLSGADRNTANKDGLLTVRSEFFISSMGQLVAVVPQGKNVQLVLFTQPF